MNVGKKNFMYIKFFQNSCALPTFRTTLVFNEGGLNVKEKVRIKKKCLQVNTHRLISLNNNEDVGALMNRRRDDKYSKYPLKLRALEEKIEFEKDA